MMNTVEKEVWTTIRTSLYPSYPDQMSDYDFPKEKNDVSNAKKMNAQVRKEMKQIRDARTGLKGNLKERVD